MTLDAIDFARLYREHAAAAGHGPKRAADWDARAADAARPRVHDDYAEGFIARMDLSGCESLLDVGCGAGTLALPLARRLRHVHALDHSRAMLDALEAAARAQRLDNLHTLHRAWEDPWDDVPVCDVAIASRSTQVADLGPALARLHAKARRRVYLTHRASGHFIDPRIPQVLGRAAPAPPDYFYVLAILHGMGIQPRLDYLEGGAPVAVTGLDELQRRVAWSLGPLRPPELARLRDWYERHDAPPRMPARRWAFISWETTPG